MKKKSSLMAKFIRIIGESYGISEYVNTNVTDPTGGKKNASRLLKMLGGEVILAK